MPLLVLNKNKSSLRLIIAKSGTIRRDDNISLLQNYSNSTFTLYWLELKIDSMEPKVAMPF